MDKSTSKLAAAGDRAADAIERWKAGMVFLGMLVVTGFAAFIVAAIPVKILAVLIGAPYLGSEENIAVISVFTALPWLITNKDAARALRTVLDYRQQ